MNYTETEEFFELCLRSSDAIVGHLQAIAVFFDKHPSGVIEASHIFDHIWILSAFIERPARSALPEAAIYDSYQSKNLISILINSCNHYGKLIVIWEDTNE